MQEHYHHPGDRSSETGVVCILGLMCLADFSFISLEIQEAFAPFWSVQTSVYPLLMNSQAMSLYSQVIDKSPVWSILWEKGCKKDGRGGTITWYHWVASCHCVTCSLLALLDQDTTGVWAKYDMHGNSCYWDMACFCRIMLWLPPKSCTCCILGSQTKCYLTKLPKDGTGAAYKSLEN